MRQYKEYMDRQTMSDAGRRRLEELPLTHRRKSVPWPAIAGLAACCCLVAGLAVWRLTASRTPGRTADGPASAASAAPSRLPLSSAAADLSFTDASDAMDLAADIALPSGSFTVELTQADIAGLFRAPDSSDSGEFPAALGWDDYRVSGAAIYDGCGQLWELSLWGELDDRTYFSLRVSPGHIPPTCVVDLGEQQTEVNGVPVSAWYQSYDRGNGSGMEHRCTTQFMAGDIGVRFANTSSPLRSSFGGQSDMALGGAMEFNARLVAYILTGGGLTLGDLSSNGNIPDWREARFTTLEEALAEPEFAPCLPKNVPEGFGEFCGGLHYQENVRNDLWVEWSRAENGEYAFVEVNVNLPCGPGMSPAPVDVSVPESYDWRLYNGPIWETVPEEYRDGFFAPVFRAEDMSLAVVEARENRWENSQFSIEFQVLYDGGAVAVYTAIGLTAEEVWALAESALN